MGKEDKLEMCWWWQSWERGEAVVLRFEVEERIVFGGKGWFDLFEV